MRRDARGNWADWFLGWLFTLLLLAFAAEALVQMIEPLLPWLGLAVLVIFSMALWFRQRESW